MSELSDYLADLPEPERTVITAVYARARALAPESVEGVSYGMPALRYRGKALLSVMNAKGHIGLYPFSPAALDTVREDLAGFSLAKGTLRFTAEQPIPIDILDRLIAARMAEIDG